MNAVLLGRIFFYPSVPSSRHSLYIGYPNEASGACICDRPSRFQSPRKQACILSLQRRCSPNCIKNQCGLWSKLEHCSWSSKSNFSTQSKYASYRVRLGCAADLHCVPAILLVLAEAFASLHQCSRFTMPPWTDVCGVQAGHQTTFRLVPFPIGPVIGWRCTSLFSSPLDNIISFLPSTLIATTTFCCDWKFPAVNWPNCRTSVNVGLLPTVHYMLARHPISMQQ